MNIVFFGSAEFATPCLKALIDSEESIIAVVTQTDMPAGRGQHISFPPIKKLALSHNLPVLQPENPKDENFVSHLKQLQPDLIVVVEYGHIIKKNILEIPKFGCINVHGSLLPRYRGAAPVQRAIMCGEKITGVTTMFMNTKMDAGDIILQESIEIGENETGGELHYRLSDIGAKLLVKTVKLLAEGNAPRIPQNHEQATLAPKIEKEMCKIDWTLSSIEIHNFIRALAPKLTAYTIFKSEHLKVWESKIIDDFSQESSPGDIIFTNKKDGLIVATGKGKILLKTVQMPNKKHITGEEFIIGYRIKPGDKFL